MKGSGNQNMNDITYLENLLFIFYLFFINAFGIIVMGIDKRKSKKGTYRIPEKTLFITAIVGGALGIYTGMKLFHHKTLHNKFVYGIPLILIMNVIAVIYIFSRL